MADVTLRITGQVRKLVVVPGDVIIVTIDNDLIDDEMIEIVKKKVQECFPRNKVLVCGPNVEIKVMREVDPR